MSFFNTRKTDKREVKDDKRASLEAFKAKADAATLAESIEKITGGALAGCHTGGMQ
jgi:hypothetical protein